MHPVEPPADPPAREAYHHGALRDALIAATESLLAERGLEGFSLREVARRSGVSPAAPAHHFGDAQGLLTAVATLAFDGLTEALEAGNARGGDDAVARLREQGVGYVDFAMKFPGRFSLMFRSGKPADEALSRSAAAAFAALENGVRELFGVAADEDLTPAQWQALLSIWSVVHGFAQLALAGQLARFAPPGGREAMLRQVLAPMLEQQLRGLCARPAKPAPRRTGKPRPR
ncbi:TetR/AcrR family transcriptional regulator [Piscinibacter sakaiensis]|uniref:TetR/AcrR family transcriptional regulator n=1 Tax=Piscinibacter sakaiensis TaxID=1547922 RepID=UPI003AB0C197